MNGRNLNVRYRRNEYAKKRNKVIAIIVTTIVVLLLASFLIVGGLLKMKVDNDRQHTNNFRNTILVPLGYQIIYIMATEVAITIITTLINCLAILVLEFLGDEQICIRFFIVYNLLICV